MRDYEFTFIASPHADEADLSTLMDRVKGLITEAGGEIGKVDMWGTRRLAYPINETREGQYVFMLVKLPPQAVVEVDRGLNLMEDVMRHLFVRVEE
jgi:small subunit ribosomal protein S6